MCVCVCVCVCVGVGVCVCVYMHPSCGNSINYVRVTDISPVLIMCVSCVLFTLCVNAGIG